LEVEFKFKLSTGKVGGFYYRDSRSGENPVEEKGSDKGKKSLEGGYISGTPLTKRLANPWNYLWAHFLYQLVNSEAFWVFAFHAFRY
jgi:hypothetical protein